MVPLIRLVPDVRLEPVMLMFPVFKLLLVNDGVKELFNGEVVFKDGVKLVFRVLL